MKRTTIGQVPLIGCGFYPSRILEKILLLPRISLEIPSVIEEDFAFFKRMKIQDFKEGFTWNLPGGDSFFIQLRGQRVFIFSVEQRNAVGAEAMPGSAADPLDAEVPAPAEVLEDWSAFEQDLERLELPEPLDLPGLDLPGLDLPSPDLAGPSVPDESTQAVEIHEVTEVTELSGPDAPADADGEGPSAYELGDEVIVILDDDHGEVPGETEPCGIQMEFSFGPEDGSTTGSTGEAPGEIGAESLPETIRVKKRG